MASTVINVANPVALPTAVQLAQIADNIAFVIQRGTQNGNYQDLYDQIQDLAVAVRCLAQAGITVNNTTASSVGSVNVRGAYALAGSAVIPANINTSAV